MKGTLKVNFSLEILKHFAGNVVWLYIQRLG